MTLRLFALAVKWVGLTLLAFGLVGSLVAAFAALQWQTGWGISDFDRCCGDYGRASLAGLLGSMFFVLAGAGVTLLSRPLLTLTAPQIRTKPVRWTRWVARMLWVYSALVLSLGIILATNLDADDGIVAGIVTYCVLAAIGLLIASWGFTRASDASP